MVAFNRVIERRVFCPVIAFDMKGVRVHGSRLVDEIDSNGKINIF